MRVCIYCLEEVKRPTKDHVFGRSYYPETTPEDVQRWTVPACRKCNNDLGQIEDEVLVRLALCLDRRKPAAKGIVEKALRSLDPRNAKSSREKKARARRQQRVLGEIKEWDSKPPGLLPFTDINWWMGSRQAVLVPKADLDAVVVKWMKGVHYKTEGRLVPLGADVDVFFVTDEVAAEAFGEIIAHATTHHKGPGIGIAQWIVREKSRSMAMYGFEVWGQFKAYGSILHPEI